MFKLGFVTLVALAACVTVPPARPAPPEPPQQLEDKSMGVAYATAFTATAAGLGFLLASRDTALFGALVLMVAPASGEIYAGEVTVPALTSLTRLLSTVVVVTEVMDRTSCYDAELEMDTSCPRTRKAEIAIGTMIAASVVDLIYTGFAVDRYNERAAATRVQLVPTSNGVALGGSF